ncbi:MAG: GerMN domain-containing protein [Candidatus Eisenbacteria bacterium]
MNASGRGRSKKKGDGAGKSGFHWKRWGLFLLFVIIAGGALWFDQHRVEPPVAEIPRAFDTAPATDRSDYVTLYFGDTAQIGLRPELRTIGAGESLESRMQACVRELAAGSLEGWLPVLPPKTRLRGAFLDTWGVAYLDFTRDLLGRRAPDDGEEWLVVAAIVRTMCDNFSEIRAVRVLIDGEMVVSLGGYMDLEEPLRAEEFQDAVSGRS